MKITDLSLIFIGIVLPLIIILYVNISFTIKAQEQEMYYQNIINIAAQDAANQMKEVENDDANIDYGYSGIDNQKVSVNAQIAVDSFLNNLYNNFDIKGNESAQKYLQLFVPAIAIIDYDGVQISSIETTKDYTDFDVRIGRIYTTDPNWSVTKHVLKPKRYYTYTYSIVRNGSNYEMVPGVDDDAISFHEIEFTMDDYITHRYSILGDLEDRTPETFYITDDKNNDNLVAGVEEGAIPIIKPTVVESLQAVREETIINTVVKEMTYAANNNNSYAKSAGITYSFSFPATTQSEMRAVVQKVGFMAFVQGLSVGNKYLNTKAYGQTNLELATRYYFSVPNVAGGSKYNMNLYHKDLFCPEYKISEVPNMSPRYAITKQHAASMVAKVRIGTDDKEVKGFYPCPICSP